jgi:hypothetical protein
MKLGSMAPLDTVRRPRPTTGIEMARLHWMPVARCKDRQVSLIEFFDVTVEHRNYLVAVLYGQGASRAKIVLHIDDNERIMSRHRFSL